MNGTPGGVGLFMKPPTFLKHGDEVRVRRGDWDSAQYHPFLVDKGYYSPYR